VKSEPFQDDAGLLPGSELAAGDAFDIPYELLRFFGPIFHRQLRQEVIYKKP